MEFIGPLRRLEHKLQHVFAATAAMTSDKPATRTLLDRESEETQYRLQRAIIKGLHCSDCLARRLPVRARSNQLQPPRNRRQRQNRFEAACHSRGKSASKATSVMAEEKYP